MEGALAGVRSIALSQVSSKEGMGDLVPFDAAIAWGDRVLRPLLDAPWVPRTLVNINFPALAADQILGVRVVDQGLRSEEHTSELQSLMRNSYAVFCLKKKHINKTYDT